MFLSNLPYQLFSQATCSGIWGKPLVNITFGAGPNPGPPLKAATPVYSYTASDCPADGSYTVRNKTNGCFFNDWHSLAKDHTGDSSGYFLLVNSSFQPNTFYLDTIRNLCASTTYEFGAWILSMTKSTSCAINGVKPNIIFRVEKTNGELLESFNTNDIASTTIPEWKQYAFVFSTMETSIVLRMTNINPGGCGGDFALDDITLRPCIADVNINLANQNDLPQSIVYHCKSSDTSFTFKSNFTDIYKEVGYLWQSSVDSGKNWINIPGANQSSYTQNFPATNKEALYIYRLSLGEIINLNFPACLVQANVDSVLTVAVPVPSISGNSPVCERSLLIMSSSGGSAYTWTGPGNYVATGKDVSIANVQKSNGGKYFVNVTSQFGCSTSDSIAVIINSTPNAFAGNDTTVCDGTVLQLNGMGGNKYTWSPATGLSGTTVANPKASPRNTTTYVLRVSNQFNCVDTASITITVLKTPIANAGEDKQFLKGTSTQLDGTVTGAQVSYFWTPDLYITNPNILQPLVDPIINTVYTLHVISDFGCGTSTDDVYVTVLLKPEIPNVFSPNNDGINDTWVIKELAAYNNAEVTVYDRYGQKVFISRGYNNPWDGRRNGYDLPVGTYYYIIDLKKAGDLLRGSVTILR